MTHKEMTAHIRHRVKVAGIKASVAKYTSCGEDWIRVSTRTCDQQFALEEQERISIICQANGLTGPRGLPIDPRDPIGNEGHFVFHGTGAA